MLIVRKLGLFVALSLLTGQSTFALPDLTKKFYLSLAKSSLPPSFFRHARWVTQDHENRDLPKLDEPMSMEEFNKAFPPISHERAVEIYYIVGVTQMLLADNHIPMVPIGGTLLGMLRNQGLLPHDDDADFAVLEGHLKDILALQPFFKKYGLSLRKVPGLSLQVYLSESHESVPKLGKRVVKNLAHSHMPRFVKEVELTKHGFIDLMAVRYHEDVNAYRYSQELSEEIWWHETLSPELFARHGYQQHRFGPLLLSGAPFELCRDAILESYPDSLTHAMRTVDHRAGMAPEPLLVPLTDEQKQPFPLNTSDRRSFEQRLSSVGLMLGEEGKVRRLSPKLPFRTVQAEHREHAASDEKSSL